MYSIQDQLYINISVGGEDVLLHEDSFVDLNFIESAGTNIPTAALAFKTSNEKILRRINEGNKIKLSVGPNQNDLEDLFLILQKPILNRYGSETWFITGEAVKASLPMWAKSNVEISEKLSAVERMQEIVTRTDTIDEWGSPEKSQDQQHWIQYGCPDKKHLDDIWLHADLGETSFPLVANTWAGFRFYDAYTHFHTMPKWTLASQNDEGDPKVITIDEEFGVEQRAGFMNSIGARGIEQNQYNLNTGELDLITSDPQVLLAVTEKANISDEFQKIRNPNQILSRNTHPKYWQSFIHNFTQLTLYSSCKVQIVWKGLYYPIRPLDLVFLKERDINPKSTQQSALIHSGLYIVSKVARRATANSFATKVHLVRESFNENFGL